MRTEVIAAMIGASWLAGCGGGEPRYTAFVEGEERVIRSEVTGRVSAVGFREGDTVPAGGVLVRLDAEAMAARVETQRQALAVLAAEATTQETRIQLTDETWSRERDAHAAELRAAEATASAAAATFARETALVRTGASTRQLLDDTRARRDEAASAVVRARAMFERSQAERRRIDVARHELDALRARRAQTEAALAELDATLAKYTIRSPAVATVVQTQFIWPGELAQPGTPLFAVLDPADKYVQVYVPVPDLAAFRVGRRVAIELDSRPGERIPGEVSFVADVANFTPEKIETRSDRLGQVYRAKIRILEGPERLQPGTEGNVYLLAEDEAS